MENMPDFDSMTPEEMMAWMEALAKRQGATEGLTTSADMDVPEIDPNSVEIDEPGYIPYGMDPEVWAQKKAVEDEARAARIAAMRSEKGETPEPQAEHEADLQPESGATNPLQFLADLSGVSDADEFELPAAISGDAVDAELEADDFLASLGSLSDEGQAADDWMPSLDAAPDLGALESLDFGSLEGLGDLEPAAAATISWSGLRASSAYRTSTSRKRSRKTSSLVSASTRMQSGRWMRRCCLRTPTSSKIRRYRPF